MPSPATTPYRIERITALNSALYGGCVLKDSGGIIVCALPGGDEPPLSDNHETARLLAAGANHVRSLVKHAYHLQAHLKTMEDGPARRDIIKLLDAADRAAREIPKEKENP